MDEGEVDLWYVFSDQGIDAELLSAYREMLSDEEQEQAARFAVEEPRRQFLVGRALVRAVLSHYTGDDPRTWVFERNAYGKPSVAGPARPPLEFNLSHTRGLIACGVTPGRELGVDVEALDRGLDHLPLARRYFAPIEVEALEGVSPEKQRAAFFQLWTLKEAFVKARGRGLTIPLDEFAFVVSADRPPQLLLNAPDQADAGQWQFAQLGFGSRFQMAVAVRQPTEQRLSLRVRETVPLHWEGDERVLPPEAANRWSL
jgi:4'-phosphopantetheinyl transferase